MAFDASRTTASAIRRRGKMEINTLCMESPIKGLNRVIIMLIGKKIYLLTEPFLAGRVRRLRSSTVSLDCLYALVGSQQTLLSTLFIGWAINQV